jgi:hypothetical protein
MKKLAIFLSLLIFVISATFVYASSGAWTGPDGVTLHGLTYNTSFEDQGITWYEANGNTWRTPSTVTRYISVKLTTYNNCGGFHMITEAAEASTNAAAEMINGITLGSSQCPEGDLSFVQNNGRHHEELWDFSTFTQYTQEITNVP